MTRHPGRLAVDAPPPRGHTPRSKPATQVGAVCLDDTGGRLLLITSRDTGRWVIPKGWPMRHRSLPGSAMCEAWEEAGVKGRVGRDELGRYRYDKLRGNGFAIPVEVRVFGVAASGLADRFPEVGQRERGWFDPREAAGLVAEEGLSELMLRLPAMVDEGLLAAIAKRR